MRTNYWLTAAKAAKTSAVLRLPLAFLLSVVLEAAAAPRAPFAPLPEPALLFSERFDEPLEFPTNQVDSSVFAESWSGYALNREPATILAPWVIPVTGPGGSPQIESRAALRFWFMPAFTGTSQGGAGAGNEVTLLTVVSSNAVSASSLWTLAVTADGNQVELNCQTANGPPTQCLSSSATFQQGSWTLITLCYTETNTALFLNDHLVASGAGLPSIGTMAAPFSALIVGSSLDGGGAGQFEELAVFSGFAAHPYSFPSEWGLDPVWDIAIYYSDLAPIAALGPVVNGSQTKHSPAPQAAPTAPQPAPSHIPYQGPISPATAESSLVFDGSNFVTVTTIIPPFPPTNTVGLQLVSSPPKVGTFWSMAAPWSAPLPLNPCPTCSVYEAPDGSGSFIVDDREASSVASADSAPTESLQRKLRERRPATRSVTKGRDIYRSSPKEPEPNPRKNTRTRGTFMLKDDPIGGGGLSLEITNASNGYVDLILWGTTNGAAYTLLSCQDLSPSPNWMVEQDVIGAAGQDFTPVQVPKFGRSRLFFWAHAGADDGPRVLFIQISGVSHGVAQLQLYSTAAGQTYDVISSQTLGSAPGAWTSEGTFLGQANWTSTTVATGSTKAQFFQARCWADYSSGSGIPDWWMQKYFGVNRTNWPDAYAQCPSADGWSILQAYQNGFSPMQFYTPPTPQGVTVAYNSASGLVTVNWQPSPGPVTNYTVQRLLWPSITNNFAVSTSAVGLQETLPESPSWPASWGPTMWATYSVQAHYAGGDSRWGAPVPLEPDPAFSAVLAAGHLGLPYLAIANLPSTITALRLTRIDEAAIIDFGDTSLDIQWDIPLSQSPNGVYAMPTNAVPADPHGLDVYQWWVQTVDSNNGLSAGYWLTWSYGSSTNVAWMTAPFFDGRQQLKQNLNFLFRSAVATQPFGYCSSDGLYAGEIGGGDLPTNYVYAGLYQVFDPNFATDLADRDELRPFEENYLYRNFVFDPGNLNPDGTPAGLSPWSCLSGPSLAYPPAYHFQSPSSSAPIPAILDTNAQKWTCLSPLSSPGGDLSLIDVTDPYYYSPTFYMTNTQPNYFGLPFLSAHFAYTNVNGMQFSTLYAGGSIPAVNGGVFAETATPGLTNVGYYFARPYTDPLPGQEKFSSTNTTAQPMIVGFTSPDPTFGNQSFEIAGYAKLALTNGYPNVFGYLGQYFEQALVIGTNGVTANSAGFLSPYGDFVPTMPGPAALVTMPDIDTGQRGTGVVNVIKLQLDVNHDGVMDLSFGGADSTSLTSPYVFWCNNNFDRWATNSGGAPVGSLHYTDAEQDDQETATSPAAHGAPIPDCNYSNSISGFSYRAIPCTRDLEDFARLWICGISTNLLSALPTNSTITLSWGDVGAPNQTSPTIDLFAATDPDGGIGYQTNEAAALQQTGSFPPPFIGRLGPGQSLQLNSPILGLWPGNYFIWCGVSNGSGGLTLTIADANSNVLAQTAAYIQIEDIKQMYERWTAGDDSRKPPTNHAYLAQEGLAVPFQFNASSVSNTPYILHVHGFNMPIWEKDRFAETAFKRLYWQGYQGRFGSFRWPTTVQRGIHLHAFDDSESNAWSSATALLNLLTNLNVHYPGRVYLTAHSHGGVVAGEALRLATARGPGQVVNTYVAMQVALDSHTYDPTTPTRLVSFNAPDRYGQYYTNGAPCYFNGVAGAGTYVNFFNTNDFALSIAWQTDQNTKWDTGYDYSTTFDRWYRAGLILDTPIGFPQDTYTIFSYCDQAHGFALGMQPNVGGPFITGTNYNQVDLGAAPYSFGRDHVYHSAEFRSDNAQRWQFWNQVLIQMGLKRP